jgi:hypothetical protein
MSKARAVRYRRLALAEEDKAKADLLLLADECDRGPVRVAASSKAAHPHVPLLVGRQDYRHRLKMDRLDPGVRRGQTRLEFPNVSYLPHYTRILNVPAYAIIEWERPAGYWLSVLTLRRNTMVKTLIVTGAMLAMATAAAAADLPHAQPVYQQAQVGKMPIGKMPIGKSPIGKAPVVSRSY